MSRLLDITGGRLFSRGAMDRLFIRASTAFICLLLAATGFAQGRRGQRADDSAKDKVAAWHVASEVAGKITDEAGKGIPDAKVTFVFAQVNEGFFATTKKGGEFSAKGARL